MAGRPPAVSRRPRAASAALEEAGGVPRVCTRGERRAQHRGTLATGWPFVRWIRRLRPDPLRRLRLRDRAPAEAPGRSDMPPPSTSSTHRWRPRPATSPTALPRGCPCAVAGTHSRGGYGQRGPRRRPAGAGRGNADLQVTRPRWWRLASVLQRLLALAVVVGMVWLFVLGILGYLRIDEVIPTPELAGPGPVVAPARRIL